MHPALCIALADVWLRCSCSAMETHSMKLFTQCSWANLKATWSLEVCSDWLCRKLATSARYVPQHSLNPLYHFTWPTTLWLSCCHSQSLPLCYNTTDSRLWNIYEWGNSMTGLVAQVASYHSTTLEFTGLLRVTFSSTNVCRNSLHAQVLPFIHLWPWKWLEHLISILNGWVNPFGNIVDGWMDRWIDG